MTNRGAIVVCGGRSRRLGRSNAWLEFGPERMLQRVVRLVGSVTEVVVVVAAHGQDLPDLPASVAVVRDTQTDQGPLRGLATGLAALPDRVDLAYATATDAPFLQPAWVEFLDDVIGDHDLAIPEVGGFFHPLAALYRRRPVLQAAEMLLKEGRLRPVFLLGAVRGRVVEADELVRVDPVFATLRNLNTPEDYRQAVIDAGFSTIEAP